MQNSLLLFAAAGVLTLGAHAHAATNPEVDRYLARAGQTATADLAAAGVEAPTGLTVKARVSSDGRLDVVRVTTTPGALETELKAAKALRHFRVAAPPLALVGATINLAIAPQPIVTAKTP